MSVFHFDCFWMREFNWCDFEWDPRVFPDPDGMLARLHEKDLRVCVWINPYIAQRSPLFAEAAASGLPRQAPRRLGVAVGSVAGGHGPRRLHEPRRDRLVPGASSARSSTRAWTASRPTSASASRSRSTTSTAPTRRACTTSTRSCTTRPCTRCSSRRGARGRPCCSHGRRPPGGQSMPVHWGGDSTSTFASMAETLRGGLSLALQRLRALEPRHRRVRGNTGCRSLQALDRLRSARLAQPVPRLGLVPGAVGVRRGGRRGHPHLHAPQDAPHALPLRGEPRGRIQRRADLRPMQLEFPDDPAVAYLDRQYMLGADILVAPVFSATGDVEFYLPAGTWTNLLTGEEVAGGAWRRERHGFTSLPIYVRPGAVIPWGARSDRPGLRLPRRAAAAGVRRRVGYDGGHRHDARWSVRDVRGGPGGGHGVSRRVDAVPGNRTARSRPAPRIGRNLSS